MAIRVLSTNEINIAKYNAEVQALENLQEEAVEGIKEALDLLTDMDHLHDIKNYIKQLLIEWEEFELREEEEDDE
jgi:hypothetical protein